MSNDPVVMNPSDRRLLQACRILLSSDTRVSHALLLRLQMPDVKKAYRKMALLVHPDRFATSDEALKKRCAEAFLWTNWAYQQLSEFIRQRDKRLRMTVAAEREPARKSSVKPHRPSGEDLTRRFYRGNMPMRPLLFGEFLYYSGLIPWKALIEAIVWQQRQRPRFGEVAMRWFHLSNREIERILSERKPSERIGEAAVRTSLLTRFQVNTILSYQRSKQRKIGEYFVENGYLAGDRILRLVAACQSQNRRFAPSVSSRRGSSAFTRL